MRCWVPIASNRPERTSIAASEMRAPFAVWLTGLPGSRKSAVAKQLFARLHERGLRPAVLESDVMRTQITPSAGYDEDERRIFYAALVHLG